ncbi:MAG: hypothetical protein ACTHN5_04845 [Phycisphaerae bacterium]
MKLTQAVLLAGVVVASGAYFGCEADESAPTRPRTQGILAPDEKAKDNAEKRETEEQKRDLPTGRSEFPGQSRVDPEQMPAGERPVVLADAGGSKPAGWSGFATPIDNYTNDNYGGGPVPPLNPKPGANPTPGSAPVPGTPWHVDFDWGEIGPLAGVEHRAWPEDGTSYVAADVKHDPVYYFSILPQVGHVNNGSWQGNAWSGIVEIPWFYLNTAALPVLMVLDPPLQQRTTERLSQNPVYLGYLPAGGEVVPAPTEGRIEWRYPFLEKQSRNPNDTTYNEPATTQTENIPTAEPAVPPPATQPAQ